MIGFESERVRDKSHPCIWFRYTVSASIREKSGFGVVTELDCRLLTVLGNNQV